MVLTPHPDHVQWVFCGAATVVLLSAVVVTVPCCDVV